MIDILVPVLERPQNAAPLARSLRQHTAVPYTLLFLTSPDDGEQFKACCLIPEANVLEVESAEGGDYARKINRGFRETISPFVLCAADDLEFTPGWDLAVLDAATRSGKGVIGTNDTVNREVMRGTFATHPLVRRDYIEYRGGSLDGPGILYHEGYDHNYPDRELAGVAKWRNQWQFCVDSKVIHHHPGWGKGTDLTYMKGHRAFREDHALFIERAAGWDHHGLTPGEMRQVRIQRVKAERRSPNTRRR